MARTFVYRDGARLTLWMLYVVLQLEKELSRRWGVHVIVQSAIRTYEEQKDIFLRRYVTAENIRGRKVYDTRWWNGRLWYRIDKTGTVRQPGLSNHEIRGTTAAFDLRDTGLDAGITVKNSERGRWFRNEFMPKYGMDPEGDSFGEGWHSRIRNIDKTPPALPAGGSSKTEEVKVKHYFNDDGKALRKDGLDLAPGAGSWLHKDAKASTSKATNIIGGVGEYDFTVHVYADGKPGDIIDVVLAWDNTKTSGPHSMHFVERMEIGSDGTARRNIPFARPAVAGNAVYARVATPKTNKGTIKVTRFATDALLFVAA